MLSVQHIGKKQGERLLLNDVSFDQPKGQSLAIMGETGSGKSTLLKILSGFVQPDAGRVEYEGKKVLGPEDQLIAGHPQIAYLSQHFELRNNYWVYEILEYANKLDQQEADELFRICQIDHLLQRRTNGNLSGGEKQRIATARLLVNKPKWLLLDEPFSNLDLIHRNIMKKVLHDLGEKLGITSMLVSHEPGDILGWADRLLILRDGAVEQDATPEHIYRFPQNDYCAGLLGKCYLLPEHLAKRFACSRVRPEQIVLSPDGVEALLRRRIFLGHLYEYVVELEGFELSFYHAHGDLPIGSMIRINCFI